MPRYHRAVMGWRAAVWHLYNNDDMSFLGEPGSTLPVSAALIADIFDRTPVEMRAALDRLHATSGGH